MARIKRISRTRKSASPNSAANPNNSVERLINYTERSMRDYGTEVVEARAIPDYRDGLKPVHRCILWAMYKLGLHHTSQFKKAARTVGEVMAKYHPHGDQSTYGAMVGMSGVRNDKGEFISRNSAVPLVEGYGNWGDNTSNAAAMRYTEARLSKFADLIMLDPNYLAVVDMVPNFSEDEKMPLILPAKLPVSLLNESMSIAVGVAASCPGFKPEGLITLIKMMLKRQAVDVKTATRTLKFAFPYGGNCVSPLKDVAVVLKTGRGSLQFQPDITVDDAKREVIVSSACPGFTSQGTIQSTFDRIAAVKGVASVVDESGKHKTRYVVRLQRNIGENFDAVVDKIYELLTKSNTYDIGMTIRQAKGGATFKRTSVLGMLEEWVKWRVQLEVKVVKRLMEVALEKLSRLETMVLAIDNLQVIIASLKVDDSAAYLMAKLKITKEQAEMILEMKVRQLKALEKKTLLAKIKELKDEIATLKVEVTKPSSRVFKQLSSLKLSDF